MLLRVCPPLPQGHALQTKNADRITGGISVTQGFDLLWTVDIPDDEINGPAYWHFRFLPAGIPHTSAMDIEAFQYSISISSPGFIIV
jgi:hypothetical protein